MNRITVFCGSACGNLTAYADNCNVLAELLFSRQIGLVYGGGNVGLMGILADAMLARGSEVIGVIPEKLAELELAHPGVADMRVVKNMHQRKALMASLCDGFIAMPGGIGTMEELFEALTWLQLGYHEKPVGLLNVAGYYDLLSGFIRHMTESEFFKPKHQELLIVENSPADLLDRMMAFDYKFSLL